MKYVPIEKRSKKAQKAYHAARRGSWNGVRPVTKTVESKKIYDRKRMKRGFDPDASSVFALSLLSQRSGGRSGCAVPASPPAPGAFPSARVPRRSP